MFCKRDTTDPIARKIYDTRNLMIVERGFSRENLFPGMFIVSSPTGVQSDPFSARGSELFKGWKDLPVGEEVYTNLTENVRSSKIAVDTAATLAGALTGKLVDKAKFAAAFEAANVTTFDFAVLGAVIDSIRVSDFESRGPKLTPTDMALRFLSDGRRLFLITDTLLATGVTAKLDNAAQVKALMEAGAGSLAELGLKLSADSSEASSILLQPQAEEVVIAFRCAQLIFRDDQYLYLKKPKDPLPMREDGHEPASHQDISGREDLLVSLGEAA